MKSDRYYLTDGQIADRMRQAHVGAYRLRQAVPEQTDEQYQFCAQLADILDDRSKSLLLMCMRGTSSASTVDSALLELDVFLDRASIALADA